MTDSLAVSPRSPTATRISLAVDVAAHPHISKSKLPALISARNARAPALWAQESVLKRLPQILDQLLKASPQLVNADFIQQLKQSIVKDDVLPTITTGPDSATWAKVASGQRWQSAGWLFVEAYLYRVLLEHTQFFAKILVDSDEEDPFAPLKQKALAEAMPTIVAIETEFNHLVFPKQHLTKEALNLGLYSNLWSNKADLSKNPEGISATKLIEEIETSKPDVLIDDTEAIYQFLLKKMPENGPQTLHFVTDNAGLEIVTDLYLAELFLHFRLATSVVFHVKYHPTFVSDATTDDIWFSIQSLANNPALADAAARFRRYIEQRKFILSTDPYWTSFLPFWSMPKSIETSLGDATLVIVKGDANTRRLHGDLAWPFETPTKDIINYFPTNLAIVRTLKSETVSGVPLDVQKKLSEKDPSWYYDGKYGTVQFIPVVTN